MRPDIAFAVTTLARFLSKANKSHWIALKQILRYLNGTVKQITFDGDKPKTGNKDDRKSTSGYLFRIAGGPVSWRSKNQDTVALSTAEAEYLALSSAAQAMMWLRRLNSDLGNKQKRPTIVNEDN